MRNRAEEEDPEKRKRNSLAALATLFTSLESGSEPIESQGVSESQKMALSFANSCY